MRGKLAGECNFLGKKIQRESESVGTAGVEGLVFDLKIRDGGVGGKTPEAEADKIEDMGLGLRVVRIGVKDPGRKVEFRPTEGFDADNQDNLVTVLMKVVKELSEGFKVVLVRVRLDLGPGATKTNQGNGEWLEEGKSGF